MIFTKAILDIGVIFVTVLIMVAVGMELEPRHFRDLWLRKRLLLVALASQFVALPALGYALTRLMMLHSHINAGILLLAACPVGDIANLYTYLARGNVALSVSVNAFSCLLTMLTMAVIFEVYDHVLGEHFVLAVPTLTLVVRLTLMVVLPVLTGMMIRRCGPVGVERHARIIRNGSIGGVGFLVLYVMLTQRQQLATDWQQTALAGAVFMTLAMLSGLTLGRMLKVKAADGITLGFIFAARNVGLATAIAVTILNKVEYAVFAVVYFLTEVPLLLGAVAVYRTWFAGGPRPERQASDGGTNA